MSGTVTQQRQLMSYQEFVWFILSEEDKGTSTAAEFWFRIMDRDGDGVITLEDLEFFYKEQVRLLVAKSEEADSDSARFGQKCIARSSASVLEAEGPK